MTDIRSWKVWVIFALALGTLACANREERRERREQVREERQSRADERYQARLERDRARRAEREGGQTESPRPTARERAEQRRAQREQPAQRESSAQPPAQSLAASAPAAAAGDGSSKVIFMRVSKQSGGVDAALFDVTEPGDPKFIGTVNAASKLSYALKPGLYTFMVVGETAEFMQAAILEGRTYYALIIPKAGAKRFGLEPVRRDELGGKEFQGWDRGTRLMTGTKGQASPSEAADKRGRHWPEWTKMPESQRATLTLNAEDGR